MRRIKAVVGDVCVCVCVCWGDRCADESYAGARLRHPAALFRDALPSSRVPYAQRGRKALKSKRIYLRTRASPAARSLRSLFCGFPLEDGG